MKIVETAGFLDGVDVAEKILREYRSAVNEYRENFLNGITLASGKRIPGLSKAQHRERRAHSQGRLYSIQHIVYAVFDGDTIEEIEKAINPDGHAGV